MTPTPDLVALNRIRAGRIDDFERWLREVVFPAAPTDADGRRWEVLRAGTSAVLFLFYGGEPTDWDLEAVLAAEYGAERAKRELETAEQMLDGDQELWAVTAVRP